MTAAAPDASRPVATGRRGRAPARTLPRPRPWTRPAALAAAALSAAAAAAPPPVVTGAAPLSATMARHPPTPAAAQTLSPDVRRASPVATPQRIVSLVPSLTETVCALGACDRLVGTDRYSDWPASVVALPKLGGLGDAQLERIVALRPDLVLVAPSERVVDRLRALGLRVVTLPTDTLADVRAATDRIADALGTPERSALLWHAVDAERRAAARDVPAALHGRSVYFEVDPTPYAAGAASYLGQALAGLGLVNIAPAALGPFPRLNPEYVVAARPDIVMATADALAGMPARPGWAGLPGLRPGQRCGYARADNAVLVRPGPRLGAATRILARCLAGLRLAP